MLPARTETLSPPQNGHRASAQTLAALVQASQDALISRDMDGRITSWNRAAEQLFGHAAADIIGQHIDVLFQPTDRDHFHANQRLLRAGLSLIPYEAQAITRDGQTLRVAIHCAPIRDADGHLVGVAGAIRDTATPTQLQSDLRRRKSNMRAIADNATIGISVMQNGQRVFANRRLAQMLGYPIAELLTHHNADVVREDLRAQITEAYLRQARDPMSEDSGQTILVHKDGSEIPVHWTAAPIEWNGHPAVMTFVTDISEQLRTQAQQAALEAHLREAQKLDALGTLAAGIAHDFNNALSAIIGNTELARSDVGDGHPAMESLNEINKASRRARHLVEQILTFGRRQSVEHGPLALEPVVSEAVSMLRATLPASVELLVHIDPALPGIMGDATQIHQVILNLSTNAWHALGEQRGRIEIRGERVQLDAPTVCMQGRLSAGPHVCLLVRDNGSGMDRSILRKIFEPFFTTKPVGEGTGIGLSVVHGIVREHGGAIDVHSEPGKGTEVRAFFPASAAPAVPAGAAATPAPSEAPSHARVLYLDDDEALVWLTTRLLKRAGFQVSGFVQPVQALHRMREDPQAFDLVVTDYNMPGMNGLEFAREVLAIRPDVPFAIASGYVSDELRAKAAVLGVHEVIYKPDTVDDLVAEVQRLLVRRQRGA